MRQNIREELRRRLKFHCDTGIALTYHGQCVHLVVLLCLAGCIDLQKQSKAPAYKRLYDNILALRRHGGDRGHSYSVFRLAPEAPRCSRSSKRICSAARVLGNWRLRPDSRIGVGSRAICIARCKELEGTYLPEEIILDISYQAARAYGAFYESIVCHRRCGASLATQTAGIAANTINVERDQAQIDQSHTTKPGQHFRESASKSSLRRNLTYSRLCSNSRDLLFDVGFGTCLN